VDAAGNASPVTASTYLFDTTAPAAPTISGAPVTPGADRSPTWSFTGETGATATCSLASGRTTVIPDATCTSPVTFDLSARPDATYTFAVAMTDGGGNSCP